jgi:hypothetical protein
LIFLRGRAASIFLLIRVISSILLIICNILFLLLFRFTFPLDCYRTKNWWNVKVISIFHGILRFFDCRIMIIRLFSSYFVKALTTIYLLWQDNQIVVNLYVPSINVDLFVSHLKRLFLARDWSSQLINLRCLLTCILTFCSTGFGGLEGNYITRRLSEIYLSQWLLTLIAASWLWR